jgi:hypothetical protein
MASVEDSAFSKFSPLQPAIFAAEAGTTAKATAAIAAAPSNFFHVYFPSSAIAECCEGIDRRSAKSFE